MAEEVKMEYDIDYDFEFEEDEWGTPRLPQGVSWRGNLCVLPNGKYLPVGNYVMEDGSTLIYEPSELSFFGKMLSRVQ